MFLFSVTKAFWKRMIGSALTLSGGVEGFLKHSPWTETEVHSLIISVHCPWKVSRRQKDTYLRDSPVFHVSKNTRLKKHFYSEHMFLKATNFL